MGGALQVSRVIWTHAYGKREKTTWQYSASQKKTAKITLKRHVSACRKLLSFGLLSGMIPSAASSQACKLDGNEHRKAGSRERSQRYRDRKRAEVKSHVLTVKFDGRTEFVSLPASATLNDLGLLVNEIFEIRNPLFKNFADPSGPGIFHRPASPIKECNYIEIFGKKRGETMLSLQPSGRTCLTCLQDGLKCLPSPISEIICGMCQLYKKECKRENGGTVSVPVGNDFPPQLAVQGDVAGVISNEQLKKAREVCEYCGKDFLVRNIPRHHEKCRARLMLSASETESDA